MALVELIEKDAKTARWVGVSCRVPAKRTFALLRIV